LFIKTILLSLVDQNINIRDLICNEIEGDFYVDTKKIQILKDLVLQHGIESMKNYISSGISHNLKKFFFWESVLNHMATAPIGRISQRDLVLVQEITFNNTSELSQSTVIKLINQTYLLESNLENIVNVEVTTNTIGTQTGFGNCESEMYRDTSDYLFRLGDDGEIANSSDDY